VVGKPSVEFFRTGLRRLGLRAEEVAMVGDDLAGDVIPAMEAGLRGVLVRTGKYRDRDAAAAARANLVAGDLAEVVDRCLRGQWGY
jgi:ribonucleotide monophosphatase NagD (HAD superfamily)